MDQLENKENIQYYKDMIKNLDLQLKDLYAQKEYLEKTIGTSDVIIISQMFLNIKQQLKALYQEKKEMIILDGSTLIIPVGSKIYVKKSNIKKS